MPEPLLLSQHLGHVPLQQPFEPYVLMQQQIRWGLLEQRLLAVKMYIGHRKRTVWIMTSKYPVAGSEEKTRASLQLHYAAESALKLRPQE